MDGAAFATWHTRSPGSLIQRAYAHATPDQKGARGDAPARIAFRSVNSVGVQNKCLSRLDGWPMRPYRRFGPALTDKPARLGFDAVSSTPSSWWTFTTYSLPVSRRI